jgi:hypothetical protein
MATRSTRKWPAGSELEGDSEGSEHKFFGKMRIGSVAAFCMGLVCYAEGITGIVDLQRSWDLRGKPGSQDISAILKGPFHKHTIGGNGASLNSRASQLRLSGGHVQPINQDTSLEGLIVLGGVLYSLVLGHSSNPKKHQLDVENTNHRSTNERPPNFDRKKCLFAIAGVGIIGVYTFAMIFRMTETVATSSKWLLLTLPVVSAAVSQVATV